MTVPHRTQGPDPDAIHGPSLRPPPEAHETTPARALGERATQTPGALSPRDVIRLQRLAGNRAVGSLLARPGPAVQRTVRASASWLPAPGGPEEGLIQSLDTQVATAEAAAVAGVQTTTGQKTPMEANYIRSPTPTSWGYVVEEKLNLLARPSGWQTQQPLNGARPDYYRASNGIGVYVDLTTARQAGLHGDHITEKLDNAGFVSPDATVAAADVTHQSQNPRGAAGAAVVLGNATVGQMGALQSYRRLTKRYIGKKVDVDFNAGIARVFAMYGDITPDAFTNVWKASQRKKFKKRVNKALNRVEPIIKKEHRTRSRTRARAGGH